MISGHGKSVYEGIAIGRIYVFQEHKLKLQQAYLESIEDIEEQVRNYLGAKETAKKQIKALYDKTVIEIGQEEAMILDVQLMMLDDLDYVEAIEGKIRNEKKNAAWAIHEAGEDFARIFIEMEDSYMKARAIDIRDISQRLACIVSGAEVEPPKMTEPMIVIADDLAPSETVQFEKDKLLGFVTKNGSSNSHTAILARTMGLPALVNAEIEINQELQGHFMIVDGNEGSFVIDPSSQLLQQKEKEQRHQQMEKAKLCTLIGQESITIDGTKIHVYSNIGGVDDVDSVLENDSEGIGLFRSEFLYLGREEYPSEEEQFKSYKKVVSRMQGKKVIIRTLDIGADKQAEYFGIGHEDNPALGYRAIRICLDRIDIFKTQLRAIYRASAYGNLGIMFPMIISVEEIRKIKQIVKEVKIELNAEGVSMGNVELGIMIETPAAVFISDDLAKEVQFFSVGTNDLTQYTLAIDRQNQHLDAIYDAHHPAVLRMLQMIVENAHKNGIWAGICGELGADLSLTELFLRMGYDELSVSPSRTLLLRQVIREIDLNTNQ